MAHYTASIETPRPLAETFAYLSDFSTTEEWDPGVVEARRIGDGPVGEGTEFRLVADFLGRKAALTYGRAPHGTRRGPRRDSPGGVSALETRRQGRACEDAAVP